MNESEFEQAVKKGSEIVTQLYTEGCDIIGFGEMGIGNTSSASLIMSHICDLKVSECVGRGTGLNDEGVKRKIKILEKAKSFHHIDPNNIKEVLSTYGGFEIVMMFGAMLQAANLGMIIIIDGFIATSAY
jgi:nicotinate-nucleotide--dimethylbenzimidazole phosphoribosyltransferase